jgi:integrase
MSNILKNLKAADITHFFQRCGEPCQIESDLNWVISHWPDETSTQTNPEPLHHREVSQQCLTSINQIIAKVSTGKQRHYKQALSNLMFYLSDALQWQVPATVKQALIDRDLDWFDKLNLCASDAYELQRCYERSKTHFVQCRPAVTAEMAAFALAMEVAPFSMEYLVSLINSPDSIETRNQHTYLKVKHLGRQSLKKEQALFTRYHLPLFVYQLLVEYHQTSATLSPDKLSTVSQLHQRLPLLLEQFSFCLNPLTSAKWHQLFQATWYYRDNTVPTLLKDISHPERHVAFNKHTVQEKDKRHGLKKIYQRDWDEQWFETLSAQSQKTHWPHIALLKKHQQKKCIDEITPPTWLPDNVLPAMLYHYTFDLIRHGGVKKAQLATSSLQKYSHIESLLEAHPLSFAHAIDTSALHLWAHSVYDAVESDTHRQLLHYFFRFMQQHPLTEHLDINEFDPPISRPSVDPYRISLDELGEIIEALLTERQGHLLQRLFCAVATILGVFAMLRRGEILRLRVKDIRFHPEHKQSFCLRIENTPEGNTKNQKSRPIYTIIPEEFANLVRILMALKKTSEPNEPLIGFTGEQLHSRQLHYLLPITKALKAVSGNNARFHHLRHSGIHLFMLQALHLAYDLPENTTTKNVALQRLLTKEVCCARFDYWLERKEFSQCNDNLLFDEVGKQIGHEYYATTRWSYLHGIEWLYPFYRKDGGNNQLRSFTHAELRYLLSLNPDSNDLSRQLALLSSAYRNKTLAQRQNDPILLTENELRSKLFNSTKQNQNNTTNSTPPYTEFTVRYFQYWADKPCAVPQSFLQYLFFEMRNAKVLHWPTLSQIWQTAGKHLHSPISPSQITALSQLPVLTISKLNGNNPLLSMELACNVKNAKRFNALFRRPEWHWLALSFSLTMNRKTVQARQLTLIKSHFAQHKETITLQRKPEGESKLTIIFTPKFHVPDFVLERVQTYFTHFHDKR